MDSENTVEHALQMIMYGYPEWSQRTCNSMLWLKAYSEVLRRYTPDQIKEGHRLYCAMASASTPPSAYLLADTIDKWGSLGKGDASGMGITIMSPWRRATQGKTEA